MAAVLVVIAAYFAFGAIRGFATTEAALLAGQRMYIDASTGKPFKFKLQRGMTTPVKAPSGGNTGFPAEACYWTKDGKEKSDPTYVLLNVYRGSNDPTFCPDCERLVVAHNPRPGEDVAAPPTKQEYSKSGRGAESRR